ncbi:hypothetical protein EZV62_010112 [Acer yangbiense]|uniref:O-methyltransferase domain-containing protein n=1 Tax=Acer yangbiense TaxID=1000413 RepID=A0A5C7I2C6_9ROSI|nr:hypothetical protein EZV62_010112 [Acer yangbiense]
MAPSVLETQPEPNTQQEEEEAYYSYANNLAISVVLPMAMKTAIELDVFEIIAKAGPGAKLSGSEIATQIPTTNPNAPNMLDQILRLLASYPVLDCSLNSGQERLCGISRVSKYFSVLNCWDDNNCLRLLKNCYKAIPEDGKVIVMNGVLPLKPETSEAARDICLLHVRLMIRDDGATERTKEEYMALATGSGFKGINFVCYLCNFYIMEFFK